MAMEITGFLDAFRNISKHLEACKTYLYIYMKAAKEY